MSEKYPWEVGKFYYTKGGLIAKIVEVKSRSIPKEMSLVDLEKLMSKPHYGLSGYVYPLSNLRKGHAVEWTMGGIHSLEEGASNVADLTEKEFIP